jgi:hypothetical protein
MAFQLALILQEFTYLLALCTILYLFYWLTFRFQERSTGRVSDGLMLFHGVIFGLMIPICVAEFATYVLNTVKDYDVNPRERLASHWIQVIRPLYTWLASLEIMIWGICLMVRTSRNDRKAKVSQIWVSCFFSHFCALPCVGAMLCEKNLANSFCSL